jgi:hypothetical protein
MSQQTPITIRALLGLTKMTDGIVVPLLKGSLKGLTANSNIFNKPPVDLTAYSAAIEAFEASIPPAMDGSKTAVAQKNNLRKAVLQMYSQLARYVETNCNDDMATFLLSGFHAKQSTRTLPPPASDSIRKVEQGVNSGEVNVRLMMNKKAAYYELRWASVPPGGGPISWTNQQPVTLVKTATTIKGLTPGTTYAFQVRVLLETGYTEWSDSVTMMVI